MRPNIGLLVALLLCLFLFTYSANRGSAAKDKAGSDQSQLVPKKSKSSSFAERPLATSSNKYSKQDAAKQQQQDTDNVSPPSKASAHNKQDKRLADWLKEQKQSKEDIIELVSSDMLELLIENMKHLVVLFYDPAQCSSGKASSNKCKKIIQELENIDDETDDHGIQFVKCEDVQYAKSELGIGQLPALVYYEQHSSAPSIYSADLEQEEQVLEWLIHQKNEDTIENINRDILANMIAQQQQTGAKRKSPGSANRRPYVAVLFYKPSHEDSDQALEQLESIDDDLSEYDVHLVKLHDDLIAKKYGVRHPPGLVLFRHGAPLKYPGDLLDTKELLQWLTMPDNLETKDSIESVNEKMFHRFLKETKHLAILFYSETSACKQCQKVMEELETIDDDLQELAIRFIKVDNMNLARKYGVHALPGLVFVSKGDKESSKEEPQSQTTIYAGDLKRADEILAWLTEQKSPNSDQIRELTGKQCKDLIKSKEHVAIYLYDEDDDDDDQSDDDDDEHEDSKSTKTRGRQQANEDDDEDDEDEDDDDDEDDPDDEDVLAGLENIDTECRRQSIEFVKTKDGAFIKEFGIDQEDLPALIYFEHGQPSIYDGDLTAEEDLLDWLLEQKRDDTIEEVNRRLLEKLIESSHYLVVLFYKSNCKSCQTVLETLEKIDDDCDAYGINMVKINDMGLAKRYGIKTFPALVYFRNGNPLVYSGDLKDDEQVLEWLLDDDQRELHDEIEDINGRMLDKLIDSSPFLAALFYDDDCGSVCNKVLHELEKIDDDTDLFGIDFVKINDFQAARKYNVHTFPTLVYFRKQAASYYDGDLLDEDKVLSWLTSNDVFELEDEIEEVNKKMLDKLLQTSDYIAVYFYEKNCKKCEDVLKELEHIDDEADSLDIMFVKIRDMNYAKKFGITQAPSLVYFRKKFPSIYRGDLMKEEKVLEWLRKNRYRNPELNLFMYALFTITISFIVYTIFLMFCVKKKQD